MPVDRTRLKSRGLDRKRARLRLDDNLQLLKYTPASGVDLIATFPSGWSGEKVTDATVGAEFFEIQLAENGSTELETLFRGKVSHAKVGDLYYRFSGVDAPRQGAVRIWRIRCSSTGQRTPA